MITQQLQSTVMATAQAWVSPLTVQGVASLLSPGTGREAPAFDAQSHCGLHADIITTQQLQTKFLATEQT